MSWSSPAWPTAPRWSTPRRARSYRAGWVLGCPFSTKLLCHGPGGPPGTTAGAAQAQSRNQRAFPLNRLDPAFPRLPGCFWNWTPGPLLHPPPSPPILLGIDAGLTLFLFSFQYSLVPFFFWLLSLIKDSNSGARRELSWGKKTFAFGVCAGHTHTSVFMGPEQRSTTHIIYRLVLYTKEDHSCCNLSRTFLAFLPKGPGKINLPERILST